MPPIGSQQKSPLRRRGHALLFVAVLALLFGPPSAFGQQGDDDQELNALQNYIAKSHAQEKANWNSSKTTIASPAFGGATGNPNAILDTANQQASALRAYGDAVAAKQARRPTLAVKSAPVVSQRAPVTIPSNSGQGQTVTIEFTHSIGAQQGRAHVVSTPSGIDCPSICSAYFGPGIDVGLTATADANSVVHPITCTWESTGTSPTEPGNTTSCSLLGRFATGSEPEAVKIFVDIWGSGQKIITGNGLPPAQNQNTPVNSTFPNTSSGEKQNCVPPPGYASCVDASQGGSDFVNGSSSGVTPSGSTGPIASIGSNGCPGGAHYQCVPPLPTGCITSFWGNYGWFSFQNQCGRTINLKWVSNNNTGVWGGIGGGAVLAPGASTNIGQSPAEVSSDGGGYNLYVCPPGYDAVDQNGNGVRGPSVNYVCRRSVN